MKTIERPAAKKSPKAHTPFPPSKKSIPGFLGNALWSAPPSYPPRTRCQKDVLDIEREEAARIISEYRENEKLAADNDLTSRNDALWHAEHNEMRKLPPVEKQRIQREITQCNHRDFLVAQSRLNELKVDAADLAKTILGRLIKSFDVELNDRAWEAEERLVADFIPLHNGDSWELWNSSEILFRHSWRAVVRHKLGQPDHSIAVGTIQWLCTTEERVPFAWL